MTRGDEDIETLAAPLTSGSIFLGVPPSPPPPPPLLLVLKYLIRTNFREALISRFSRFAKNREIKDSLKLGYAKIKHAKFNTLL